MSETITFKGFEAIAVSRIDGDPALTPTIVADEDNWLDPVIFSKQSSATFADSSMPSAPSKSPWQEDIMS